MSRRSPPEPPESEGPSDSAESDIALFERAQGGDYGAFESIVKRFRDRVYRLAYGMMKNETDAEEVVQDAFLNLFRSLPTFRADSSPGTWIYRVAANSALMRLRTKRRKPLLSLDDLPPTQQNRTLGESIAPPGAWARDPGDKLLNDELSKHVFEAIEGLPEKYRLVLLLRDVEGLSNEEVAESLGLTVPTVKSRLHRSRLHVRDKVDAYLKKK
ncbi:MAG: sigma-70 family RNA polymerase sigma factor [Myxococcota bacterium]